MDNLFFTGWIARHGKENLRRLVDLVVDGVYITKDMAECFDIEDFTMHYFWVVYCIIALKHLGLSEKQIAFFIDLSLSDGISKHFKPADILERHKNAIREINRYVDLDLRFY